MATRILFFFINNELTTDISVHKTDENLLFIYLKKIERNPNLHRIVIKVKLHSIPNVDFEHGSKILLYNNLRLLHDPTKFY